MSKNLLINTNDMSIFEPRRYYQEYEGTFITATNKSEDDTLDTSRYIEVTEIWGNTVQDENNLEDIQSVGELYVDDEGNPILDELGREQYKVEVESCNKNLLDITQKIVYRKGRKQSGVTINIEDFMYTEGDSGNRPTLVQKVLPNTQYNISYQEKIGAINLDINQYSDLPKYAREEESTFIKSIYYAGSLRNITITTESNCKYIGISFYTSTDAIQGFKGLQVEKNNSMSSHTVPQSNKTTILLPCQLQKVGDVYDRLYWDSEKGRYVVEKKLVVTEFDNENWNLIANKEKVILFGKFDNLLGIEWDLVITGRKNSSLCSLSTWVDVNMISDRNGHRLLINGQFAVQVVKTDLISEDLEGFKDYLSTKHKILYYPLRNSELIETNITEKILLPCYEEKTHVFVNSTVDATMKVLVPYKVII